MAKTLAGKNITTKIHYVQYDHTFTNVNNLKCKTNFV